MELRHLTQNEIEELRTMQVTGAYDPNYVQQLGRNKQIELYMYLNRDSGMFNSDYDSNFSKAQKIYNEELAGRFARELLGSEMYKNI
ncbi:hypothetical protein VXQ92_04370 [Acinetobacter sp. 228]|uniref:hypothetical protein n=1 Tax=Acinetobacter sp. 228 TaxID=3114700 RepID=UPI003A866D73